MPECKHDELAFVGEQKTDNGVNAYFKCRACGMTIVVTPERKAFALKEMP